jgi:hypothetical protein
MTRPRIKDAKALSDHLRKSLPGIEFLAVHTPYRPNNRVGGQVEGHFHTAAMAVKGELNTGDQPMDYDLLLDIYNTGNARLRQAIAKAAEQERFK